MIVTLAELLKLRACIPGDHITQYAQRWPREHWQGDAPAVELAWLLGPEAVQARIDYATWFVDRHGAKADRLGRGTDRV